MTSNANTSPQRIFIFDNPRCRSHLFFRLLSTHPQLKTHYHPYVLPGCQGPEKIHYDIYKNNPARAQLVKELWEPMCSDDYTFANAERHLLDAVAAIEKEGKTLLSSEHCCYLLKSQILIKHTNSRQLDESWATDPNPTHLPDELWKSVTPIMVIRHPALSVPSMWRSMAGVPALANMDPMENHNYWFATLTWSRVLFEALRNQGRMPIVVDGEDVCTRTDEVIRGVCGGLGIDPAGVTDTWGPWGQSPLDHPLFVEMTRTIWESDGVKKHEAKGPVDVDGAVRSVEKEFGAEVAERMRMLIDGEMDNYRFLEQFKV
ncbi:uncharacterized protein J7T54_004729 [Emericellopsis cladophorae]|uniref:Uncharacterized protein n=1 Tax=Emericellopsis cladophorae TaxID=2686198 RepID=A0A9P9Y5Y3_9HYPO|nr:uncharacterized protein J7T54_004729 [Emericellopsis cladophorae]KAI6784183.1 hypothetical protein J7T54_004729 [Emericellopsis cladophorae]